MNLHILYLAACGLSAFSILVSGQKNIFCYYSSFAISRPGMGAFAPEDIDVNLCTHIVYAFVDMTSDGKGLQPAHANIDLGPIGLYKRTVDLRLMNPDLRVLLAVGVIGSEPFLPMIRNDNTRRVWIKNAVNYLRKYEFDGLHMDWEFPGDSGSSSEDKYRLSNLLKELQDAFRQEAAISGTEKITLTLATAAGTYYISSAYETGQIVKHIDYMLLMTSNYHGKWDNKTGHHAGVLPSRVDATVEDLRLHQNWTINFWLNAGMDPSRLVVGIGTYGMSFTLAKPWIHGLNAPALGGGTYGRYTGEEGVLSYFEICEHIKQGWEKVWIPEQKAPYAFGGNQWVGFDDVRSVTYKALNIVNMRLSGAFIWSIEMDDFSGYCDEGRYPLLTKIHSILNGNMPSQEEVPFEPPIQNLPSFETWIPETSEESLMPMPHIDNVVEDIPAAPAHHRGDLALVPLWQQMMEGIENHLPPSAPSKSLPCNEDLIGLRQHPLSCKYFIECVDRGFGNFQAYAKMCPPFTGFDTSLGVCNHMPTCL